MGFRHRASTVAAVTALAALVLTACSGSKSGGGTATVYVTASAPAVSPSTGSSGSSAPPSGSATASTLTPPSSLSKIRGTCDTRLPQDVVGPAIGESLAGDTQFVVGQPDRSIKRLAYINCRYGLADANAVPAVEIQVSLYPSAAVAAARITATVKDYENNGATAKDAQPAGIAATILTGGSGADYELPTIVLAFGQRTVAVSVTDPIPAAKQDADLATLAVLAVQKTQ